MTNKHQQAAACVLMLVLAGTIPAIGAGEPPTTPDHGLNRSEFAPLWSHDVDQDTVPRNATALRALANATDMSYTSPPEGVRQWNRGDIQEFPATSTDHSIYPTGTETISSDRGWITDAYARVFAIQPSTRALVRPDRQPLFVPRNGSVLATIDYRVSLPDDETTGNRRVYYTLDRATIQQVRAVSGARVIGTAKPGHRVTVPYRGLAAGRHQVGIVTQIDIEVEKTVRTRHCNDDGCYWETNTYSLIDSVTVSDTKTVERYTTLSAGSVTQYPNGDMGVIAQQSHPWAGLSLPGNDSVSGVWRFYSGRNTAWDNLTVATESGTQRRSSPAQPLQTFAYPSPNQVQLTNETDAGVDGTILRSRGPTHTAPSLPAAVSLPAAGDTYQSSAQIAVRHPDYEPSEVAVQGLVAGSEQRLPQSQSYSVVETRASSINASVTETTSTTVTIRVELTDGAGRPINTAASDGRVVVADTQAETSTNGTTTVTVPREDRRLSVTFQPAPFWAQKGVAYTPATTHVTPTTEVGDVSALVPLLLSTLLLWLPVYMFDKMLDLGIWPPWDVLR